MALQYPLLFPYDECGFHIGVLYSGIEHAEPNTRSRMTMQDYFCYQFHYRKHQPNHFLCYALLSSQAKVDARASIDESRLQFILQNQKNLRTESVQGILDGVGRGCIDGDKMGKCVILPASHVGGQRYIFQNYHDGLAICRVHGPPDFFVTFTCNLGWSEIVEIFFEPGQMAPEISLLHLHVI
jgi:hypothetical protein